MKKIKVLHVLNTSDIGGAEKLMLDICKYTDGRLFDLIITSFESGALEEDFKKFDYVKKIDLNSPGYFNLKTLLKLNKIIKKEKIDIIQTHLQKPDVYGFFLKLMNPSVPWIIKKGNTDDYRKKWFWRISNGILHAPANLIIATSNQVKRFTSKWEFVPLRKIAVIYSGIDLKDVDKQMKNNVSGLREKIGLKKSDKVVIAVGRMVYQKGFPYLIKIMKELSEKDKKYKLLLVGDGPLRKEMETLVQKLQARETVKFLGERKDVIDLLRVSDVFCLSSVREGIPITLMETMYVGTPLVTTAVGGNKEIVEDARNGFLEKPKDLNNIKKRIIYLFENKQAREKIIKNAKEVIKNRFSVKVTAKNYEEKYKKIRECAAY